MKPLETNPDLVKIQNAFENANVPVRLVGGCVRDMLLGIKPKDWDLTTPALPDQILDILKVAKIEAFDMSNGHGTITAMVNKEPYEITTLRQDLETDGRHAVVGFTEDWQIDAERRDCTFNAMTMDWDGNIFDYFNGIADLNAGLVNFVGDADKRIQEDYLRILRFFRFLGRMPKPEADVKTLAVITANRAGLQNISGERIWSEMKKILSGDHVEFVLKLMDEAKVLSAIDVKMNINVIPASKDPVTNLAAFIDGNFVEIVIERWKLSKDEQQQLKWLAERKDTFIHISELQAMLATGTDRGLILELMKIQHREDYHKQIKEWDIPIFPVNGNDLIAAGFNPGPEMGKVLEAMKKRWIMYDFKLTKEELLYRK